MKALYDTIHAEAERMFGKPVTRENFEDYAKTWIKVANDLADQCEVQGLPMTAAEVRKIVQMNERVMNNAADRKG